MIHPKIESLGRWPMLALFGLCLFAPVCAQTTVASSAPNASQNANKAVVKENTPSKYGVGRPMGDAYAVTAPVTVPADQSRLVAYRNPAAKQQSVISVYINGGYHTSLMPAGFSVVCLQDTNVTLRTRLRPVNTPANVELDTTISFIADKGQSKYVRATEMADGNVKLDVVSTQEAARELKKTREQMHVLSRVEGASSCEEHKAGNGLEGVVLVAYIEFQTGKSRLTDMVPADLSELDRLLEKLKGQSQERLRLQVKGYANDGDKKTPSKRLAQGRAKTVEDYILSQGVKPKTLSSEFHVDQPLTTTAGNKTNSVVVLSATYEQP